MATILIVEDSPDNMKLFRTLLTLHGHDVIGLGGGATTDLAGFVASLGAGVTEAARG